MSKIRNGLPPGRTALDRERSELFEQDCASSNLLRCVFARTLRDYPILPVRVNPPFPAAVDSAGSRKEAPSLGQDQRTRPEINDSLPSGPDSRPASPMQRQTLKHPERDDFAPGGLTALLEFQVTSDTACPRTPFCNGLFGMSPGGCRTNPLRFPFATRVSEPAAKPLCYCVDS